MVRDGHAGGESWLGPGMAGTGDGEMRELQGDRVKNKNALAPGTASLKQMMRLGWHSYVGCKETAVEL